jgi:hypothetical protein
VATDVAFADAVTLTWTAASGVPAYALYRGAVDGGAWEFTHACLEPALPAPGATDAAVPPAGTAFYYLVSGRLGCGETGLGFTSAAAPRPNPSPCGP